MECFLFHNFVKRHLGFFALGHSGSERLLLAKVMSEVNLSICLEIS